MVYSVLSSGFKEEEVSFTDFFEFNFFTLCSHHVRSALQCYVVLLERSIYQAGTVHALPGSTSVFVFGAVVGNGGFYNLFCTGITFGRRRGISRFTIRPCFYIYSPVG